MIVVSIIALLVGAGVTMMKGQLEFGQDVRAGADVQNLATQLRLYGVMNGVPPSQEQGLKALMEKPSGEPVPMSWRKLADGIPRDPWGREYIYLNPGVQNRDSFDVFSKGAKLDDPSDDIGNWTKKLP